MIFLYLFYTFCKIGLFGFGGGYAMLSMIRDRDIIGSVPANLQISSLSAR